MSSALQEKIFAADLDFEKSALDIFQLQAKENEVFKSYIEQLKLNPQEIKNIEQIPFLPISFFKSHKVITGPEQLRTLLQREDSTRRTNSELKTLFKSSGTTGSQTSSHYVNDISLYEKSFTTCFEKFYGPVSDYCFLGLLPSYLERNGSSLVYMTEKLIQLSNHPLSGFYLNEFENLETTIQKLISQKQKFILLGVTFALLDFAEFLKTPFNGTDEFGIVMETGGMKGRKKEMIREEVHSILKKKLNVASIHSEYGMTELLSQAYSKGNGIFECPSWMKILLRDTNDPFHILPLQKTGGINVIDLANIYSCSFIATQDLGRTHNDNQVEVLGRFDFSDLRGCSLMIE